MCKMLDLINVKQDCIQKASQYIGIEELTSYALHELIKAIYVDAPDKSSGKRRQHIHIQYDGLGFIPPNELLAQEKARPGTLACRSSSYRSPSLGASVAQRAHDVRWTSVLRGPERSVDRIPRVIRSSGSLKWPPSFHSNTARVTCGFLFSHS